MSDESTDMEAVKGPDNPSPGMDVKDTLSKPFTSGFLESKNGIGAVIGLSAILIVFGASLYCLFRKPDIGPQIISLGTISITSIAAIVSTLLAGHTVMTWGASSSISDVKQAELKNDTATQNNNSNVSGIEEKVTKIVQTGAKYLNK